MMLPRIHRWLVKLRRSNYITALLKLSFYIIGKLPVKRNTIVFESFLGKQYSDNPKALYQYIKFNYPEYSLYWSFDRKYKKDDNFKQHHNALPRFGLKWIIIMARSQYWITNSRLPLWLPKPKHTTYVQTWHGTPLKKLGMDMKEVMMPGTNTELYKKNFLLESSKWDYLISPNRYSTDIFKSAFGFEKKILEVGYPRNDTLSINDNSVFIDKLKQNLNIPKDKRVILYAPTWRDNEFHAVGKYKFSLNLNLDKLKTEFGNDFVLLIRMHYLVSENLNLEQYKGFVYDVSDYSEISDLYLLSDVLITDYSSVFFDYANLRRPILFYTYDLDNYKQTLRGFYFDFENKAPGPIAKTTEEIIDYLQLVRDNKFQHPATFDEFYNKFCYLEDGKASNRVSALLFEKYGKELNNE